MLRPSTITAWRISARIASKIGAAEFLPLGDDDQRIGAAQRLHRAGGELEPGDVVQERRASARRHRVVGADRARRAAPARAITTRLGASRMSSVLGLKARPHTAKRQAGQVVAEAARRSCRSSTSFWASLTASTAREQRHRAADARRAVRDQRPHVLRKARAAVAAAGVEEVAADARVGADAAADGVDVGAERFGQAAPARS